jgi:hypothetical protein
MSHRRFRDSHGIEWDVWEVIPHSADRRKLRDRRQSPRRTAERRRRHEPHLAPAAGVVDGWLVFESKLDKRRVKPIPPGWSDLGDRDLESLCESATPAARRTPRLIE